jgi:hypothetical protein
MITGYWLVESLITDEQPQVLTSLVTCAEQIASRLHERVRIGNGCVEWQLDTRNAVYIQRLFPRYGPSSRTHPLRRGKIYIRKCPKDV